MGQRPATMQPPYSRYLYRARNFEERFLNKIKLAAGATLYDKRAANYLAFVQLAMIGRWLRADGSAS